MEKYIMVTTTFNDKKEASKIIGLLIGKKLVSCCQVVSIDSSYRWDGKVVREGEFKGGYKDYLNWIRGEVCG